MYRIQRAVTDAELLAAYPVIRQLRPHLEANTFTERIRQLEREDFRMLCLHDPDVRAVAGYRFTDNLACGKVLYVDDLVTSAEHRSRGYGEALLKVLLAEAQAQRCKYLELDSGLKRVDAHRFYRRHGLEPIAFRFSMPTDGGARWAADSTA